MEPAAEEFGTLDSKETDSCKLRRLTFDTLSLAAKFVPQERAAIASACANIERFTSGIVEKIHVPWTRLRA